MNITNVFCICRTLGRTFWTSYQLLSGVARPLPAQSLSRQLSRGAGSCIFYAPAICAAPRVNSRLHGRLRQDHPSMKTGELTFGKSRGLFWERKLSSTAKDIYKDVESGSEILWNHPADRTGEDVFSKDPELHSLLCEIASDFGKSPTADSDFVNTDGNLPSEEKYSPAEDGADNHKTEEVVATTTKEEAHLGSNSVASVKTEMSGDLTASSRHSSGTSFVFSIEEFIDTLRDENAQDICVIKVPPEKHYVDYFVVVTGRSTRHLIAMTQNINKLYKQLKSKSDPFVIVEGKLTDDWMCVDLGNIVVHFMLEDTRLLYDLEKLWTLGKEFDDHMQQWKQHEILMFNPETDLHAQVETQPEDVTNKDQENLEDAK